MRPGIFGLCLLLLALPAAAQTPGATPTRVRGTVDRLEGQTLVIRNPDDLLAGITTETVLAMTPDQARQLGEGLVASAGAAALRPAANDAGVPLEQPLGEGRSAPRSTPQE